MALPPAQESSVRLPRFAPRDNNEGVLRSVVDAEEENSVEVVVHHSYSAVPLPLPNLLHFLSSSSSSSCDTDDDDTTIVARVRSPTAAQMAIPPSAITLNPLQFAPEDQRAIDEKTDAAHHNTSSNVHALSRMAKGQNRYAVHVFLSLVASVLSGGFLCGAVCTTAELTNSLRRQPLFAAASQLAIATVLVLFVWILRRDWRTVDTGLIKRLRSHHVRFNAYLRQLAATRTTTTPATTEHEAPITTVGGEGNVALPSITQYSLFRIYALVPGLLFGAYFVAGVAVTSVVSFAAFCCCSAVGASVAQLVAEHASAFGTPRDSPTAPKLVSIFVIAIGAVVACIGPLRIRRQEDVHEDDYFAAHSGVGGGGGGAKQWEVAVCMVCAALAGSFDFVSLLMIRVQSFRFYSHPLPIVHNHNHNRTSRATTPTSPSSGHSISRRSSTAVDSTSVAPQVKPAASGAQQKQRQGAPAPTQRKALNEAPPTCTLTGALLMLVVATLLTAVAAAIASPFDIDAESPIGTTDAPLANMPLPVLRLDLNDVPVEALYVLGGVALAVAVMLGEVALRTLRFHTHYFASTVGGLLILGAIVALEVLRLAPNAARFEVEGGSSPSTQAASTAADGDISDTTLTAGSGPIIVDVFRIVGLVTVVVGSIAFFGARYASRQGVLSSTAFPAPISRQRRRSSGSRANTTRPRRANKISDLFHVVGATSTGAQPSADTDERSPDGTTADRKPPFETSNAIPPQAATEVGTQVIVGAPAADSDEDETEKKKTTTVESSHAESVDGAAAVVRPSRVVRVHQYTGLDVQVLIQAPSFRVPPGEK